MTDLITIDSEISTDGKKILDLGAVKEDGTVFHSDNPFTFQQFIRNCDFLCGHNVIHFDLKYLENYIPAALLSHTIDTLYLSPLLFPKKPYHALLKEDKLITEELNNPVNDCKKAQMLFQDELNAFNRLPDSMKLIYCTLLSDQKEFRAFFEYLHYGPFSMNPLTLIKNSRFRSSDKNLIDLIHREFHDLICEHAPLDSLIRQYPMELAYALSLISAKDRSSITPPWLLYQFPHIGNIIHLLCNTPCDPMCSYCRSHLDIHKGLKEFFGFSEFRRYNGEPLQEKAAQAAVDGKSLLAVFPTGGGKSITFQLPALMAGHTTHGLTVVISPLQSLMKDQVDNLNAAGFTEAVTVNGMLDPVERANAYERIKDGSATLLYLSPEMLRSRTIEHLLISRNVVRFVIDEAHCFSSWGQDFRVDYLYIADFIRLLQTKKKAEHPIPVSCFTATAKQKVIRDICDYFHDRLGLQLEIYASTATRENLHYTVLHQENEEQKYMTLRSLIEHKNCPTIVYVSRTRKTVQLAQKLTTDGFEARPYNGKMDPNEKIENQEAFINNEFSIIVATSAFGMGVDKKDVRLVVHYDISDSLENYIQEAGRAGRDPSLQADCYVLYNDNDLDKHFILLNQTKLSISEIQQVWTAIKQMTRHRNTVCSSALEIARAAGWDNDVNDIETRVKTAVAALENAGYIQRGKNVPHVYATSIKVKTMIEASEIIENSILFTDDQKTMARRIIKSLISSRSIAEAGNDLAESRVDYLADILGITKENVILMVNQMRQEGLLSDMQDMSAYIYETQKKTVQVLEHFIALEQFILDQLKEETCEFHLKELNELAEESGLDFCTVRNIRTLLYYMTVKHIITKEEHKATSNVTVTPMMSLDRIKERFDIRVHLCRFIVKELYDSLEQKNREEGKDRPVQFSLVGLYQSYCSLYPEKALVCHISLQDVQDALLYLSKTGAMKLEGGFLVLYNGMEIRRIITNDRIKYKQDDYALLNEFYKQKIRQIHIVGEFANMMVRDYDAALQFVQDYFQMDFKKFINKYFEKDRQKEIDRNITPQKYNQLFGTLSSSQEKIINDHESRIITVVAGPGSGKTRVLVHKLAALLLLEDVKHEQLLMLTFSRAAATEFKKRLIGLIGNAARFVDIKTFHSYAFDLMGKIGNLAASDNIVKEAALKIRNREVEQGKIAKTVLVIDEAQDMDENEFELVKALRLANEDLRIIAVGDDDQNIYQFRGSNSRYMKSLLEDYGATRYELNDNYRSKASIVSVSNAFAHTIKDRLKTQDIIAVDKSEGEVRIITHTKTPFSQALVRHLIDNHKEGSTCILTQTNDQALQILGLLLKENIRASLIQDSNGFNLLDIAEIRYFLKLISKNPETAVVEDDVWEEAINKLKQHYKNSTCLPNCLNLISDFEQTCWKKYRSDFMEFIRESRYEDFYPDKQQTVTISTIHKSKGREFDNVYILLDQKYDLDKDENKRSLYVGMTRAKKNLYIHSNHPYFNSLDLGVKKTEDPVHYGQTEELAMQLSHRDVYLDFFRDKKQLILSLYSGLPLTVDLPYLSMEIQGKKKQLVRLSSACVDKLNHLNTLGYQVYRSTIRFIVAWKKEEDENETAVILPDLYLHRKP